MSTERELVLEQALAVRAFFRSQPIEKAPAEVQGLLRAVDRMLLSDLLGLVNGFGVPRAVVNWQRFRELAKEAGAMPAMEETIARLEKP